MNKIHNDIAMVIAEYVEMREFIAELREQQKHNSYLYRLVETRYQDCYTKLIKFQPYLDIDSREVWIDEVYATL